MRRQLIGFVWLSFAFFALALPVSAQESVTIVLREQNASGQAGTAVLTAEGNQTRVVVTLSNPPAGVVQPAHIHEGTCANLNPQPRYPLQSLSGGRSETVIDVPLSQLLAGQFAINVHKSQQEISTYVACGEIPAQLAPATGRAGRRLPVGNLALVVAVGSLMLASGIGLRWARR